MEPQIKKYTRHNSIKTTISELVLGEFVQEGENLNYLITETGQKVFRLNVLAIVVGKEKRGHITNIFIDDGTEKIVVRSFEENETITNISIGDVVMVVGKVRTYNKEKYISPEIIKKTNHLWLKVRSLELERKKNEMKQEKTKLIDIPKKQEEKQNKNFIGDVEEVVEEDILLPLQKLSKLISELDKGEGVLIEKIIEDSPLEKTEELLEKMLENGDIFQNTPGKVKVL